jgi:hypothetical protein
MERSVLIFISLDAALTLFFFWKTMRGYFFLKDVISWEITEGKIYDIIQIKRRRNQFQEPIVQFKTQDNRIIQFKSIRVKENTFTTHEKVEVLYDPYDPYRAIIKGYENTRYKDGIKNITILIIFNISFGLLYYFTAYLKY